MLCNNNTIDFLNGNFFLAQNSIYAYLMSHEELDSCLLLV